MIMIMIIIIIIIIKINDDEMITIITLVISYNHVTNCGSVFVLVFCLFSFPFLSNGGYGILKGPLFESFTVSHPAFFCTIKIIIINNNYYVH